MGTINWTALLSSLQSFACWSLNLASDLFGSNLFLALVASTTGAFAGALGAQRVIQNEQEHRSYLQLLRASNSAIILSYTIANYLLMLKKQHIGPMCDQFRAEKEACERAFKASRQTDESSPKMHKINGNLVTFARPTLPIETLKDKVYSEISPNSRAMGALAMLEQSNKGFDQVTELREELIADFKQGKVSRAAFPFHYFGLEDGNGHVHREYSDAIDALESYLNDMIFFSSLIATDLQDYARRVREKLVKLKSRRALPKINSVDFTKSKQVGLMPLASEYSDWLSGFQSHDKKSDSGSPN